MPDWSTASTPYRTGVFLATAFTLAVLIFLIDKNLFSQSEQFHESDFIMTFYVAGRLVGDGRASELYPEPSAKTFVNSRFDKAAHEYLPKLPKRLHRRLHVHAAGRRFFRPLRQVESQLCVAAMASDFSAGAPLVLPRTRSAHEREDQ